MHKLVYIECILCQFCILFVCLIRIIYLHLPVFFISFSISVLYVTERKRNIKYDMTPKCWTDEDKDHCEPFLFCFVIVKLFFYMPSEMNN